MAGPVYDVLSLVEKPGAQVNLTTVSSALKMGICLAFEKNIYYILYIIYYIHVICIYIYMIKNIYIYRILYIYTFQDLQDMF